MRLVILPLWEKKISEMVMLFLYFTQLCTKFFILSPETILFPILFSSIELTVNATICMDSVICHTTYPCPHLTRVLPQIILTKFPCCKGVTWLRLTSHLSTGQSCWFGRAWLMQSLQISCWHGVTTGTSIGRLMHIEHFKSWWIGSSEVIDWELLCYLLMPFL